MAAKKKTARKKRSKISARKGAATRTRHELTKQLREDLRATKAAAREELKLAKSAAKAEIALLKEQLKAAQKREQALLKLAEEKAKLMWKTGEQWEKKQMAKIKKTFKR